MVGAASTRSEAGSGRGVIQMGVRPYVPAAGRFLGVDPVEGGNANDYVYPQDPVNSFDLDGRCSVLPWSDDDCHSAAASAVWSGSKAIAKKTYQVARFAVNLANGSSALGVAAAVTSGAKCGMNWDQVMVVCTGARNNFLVRKGGTTYGSVFTTSYPSVTRKLLRHEAKHSDQWGLGGFVGFGVPYAIAERAGLKGSCNPFERWAGLSDGGYEPCRK